MYARDASLVWYTHGYTFLSRETSLSVSLSLCFSLYPLCRRQRQRVSMALSLSVSLCLLDKVLEFFFLLYTAKRRKTRGENEVSLVSWMDFAVRRMIFECCGRRRAALRPSSRERAIFRMTLHVAHERVIFDGIVISFLSLQVYFRWKWHCFCGVFWTLFFFVCKGE